MENLGLHPNFRAVSEQETSWDWLSNNIGKPVYNTLVVDPENVLANAVNKTVGGGSEVIGKLKEKEVSAVDFGGGAWATRTIVQGLAAIVPYAIAGAAMRAPLRSFSGAFETEGLLARGLRSDHTAQIGGAALYDGLRDPHNNETASGNAMGSAAGFSVFSLGNTLSRSAPLIGRIPALLATGAIGSLTQGSVAKGWSQHELLTSNEAYQATVSGAFMNVGLPASQHLIGRAVSKFNMSIGRGEPLDRYVESRSVPPPAEVALLERLGNRFGTGSNNHNFVDSGSPDFLHSLQKSSDFRSLVLRNANTRVVETADTTAYVPAQDVLRLGPLGRNPIGVAHELFHKDDVKSGELERGYLQAKTELLAGNLDAARIAYRNTRVNSEVGAALMETRVSDQLTNAGPTVKAAAATTEFQQSLRTRIENFMSPKLDQEFLKFSQLQGDFRPDQYEQRNRQVQNLLWQHRVENWPRLTLREKLSAVDELHDSGPHRMPRLFTRVMTEPRPEVFRAMNETQRNEVWRLRTAMDEQFKSLPSSEKYSVWQSMLNGESYHVRQLAISHIPDLPARQRMRAFNEVLRQPHGLTIPIRDDSGHRGSRWNNDDFRPQVPIEKKNPLYSIMRQSPAELLVDSISSLPSGLRERAWLRAFNETARLRGYVRETTKRSDGSVRKYFGEESNPEAEYMRSHTRAAAIRNLEVLPPDLRTAKWFETFDQLSEESLKASRRAFRTERDSRVDETLLAQVPTLPLAYRGDALHQFFRTNFELKGPLLRDAIQSLPEDDRLPAWRKFYDRSTQEWSTATNSKYEPDAFADRIAQDLIDRNHRNTPIQTALWNHIERQLGIDKESRDLFNIDMHGVPRGLGVAIQALPMEARLPAWNDLANNDLKTYGSELMNTVPHLPPEAQPAAMRMLLKYAAENTPPKTEQHRHPDSAINLFDIWNAVPSAPPEVQTKLVKEIMTMPTGDLRERIIGGVKVEILPREIKSGEKSENIDWDERARAVAPIFEEAFAHAQPRDYKSFSFWWDQVSWPEPYRGEDATDSLMRGKLSQILSPVHLGRMTAANVDRAALDRISTEYPDVVRALASKGEESFYPAEKPSNEDNRLSELVNTWLDTKSLKQVAARAMEPIEANIDEYDDKYPAEYGKITRFVGELARYASPEERQEFFTYLKDAVLTADTTKAESFDEGKNLRVNLPVTIATRALEADPQAFQQNFLEPINTALADRHGDYSWRLNVARELAALQRHNELPDSMFTLPDLRMPKITGLSEVEQNQIRQQFTDALFDSNSARRLWGEGSLGRLFPKLFGFYESDGGIIGRPQHGGHEFPVDEHTLLVMERVRENPLFPKLSRKDQENTLIAAMMHDVAKKANQKDPDHEWAGASAAWGVLATMGYNPVRIQRINDLIARHSQVSYVPAKLASEHLADSDALDDIVNHYRQPGVFNQLRILNEADIKSIDAESSLWSPEVEEELEKVQALTEARANQLNGHIAPILTTELKFDPNSKVPAGFGLLQMKGSYALLAHATHTLNDTFLKQLNVIESPEYSVSSSLITDKHQQFYHDDQHTFALVNGPFDRISQADRKNLGTGTNVNWRRHIELTKEWSQSEQAQEFAQEIERAAQRIEQGWEAFSQRPTKKTETKKSPPDEEKTIPPGSLGQFPRLEAAREIFGEYDSLDELIRDKGIDSPELKLQFAIQHLFTHAKDGTVSDEHNEIKLNNPSVIGLGILRKGKPVYFEGMEGEALQKFLKGQEQPSWLLTGSQTAATAKRAVTIPKGTWEALLDRDFPLVVLDP